MTYSVEIVTPQSQDTIPCRSLKSAITLAKAGLSNPETQIFISCYRSTDGRKGYYNPNGNHELTGINWNKGDVSMKKAYLYHDEELGFCIIDKETQEFISIIDPGDIDGDIDWDFVDDQAAKYGYVTDN